MSITLSPETMTKAIRLAKEAGFADTTAYVEFLIDEQDVDFEPMNDAELEAILARSREDQRSGNIKDLDEAFEDIFRKHNLPRKAT